MDTLEATIRQKALKLYHDEIRVNEICRRLNRSRAWFYKWLRRYQAGRSDWYKDVSKAPHTVANKTPPELVDLILKLRKDLEETRVAGKGARSIQSRMVILGWDPLPIRTINRILKNHHVTRKQMHCRKCNKQTQRSADNLLKQLSLF
ncbi:helix-turn-helix domain-containing protein [bacterium]|nr:helix-turn-helix domain-containing protein [bacterium]RQV96724.1 MAG: helix-turn-helix domain-containing protein [bacterium]